MCGCDYGKCKENCDCRCHIGTSGTAAVISGEPCKIHAAHKMVNDAGALVCVGCLTWRDEREWPDKVHALELQIEELKKKAQANSVGGGILSCEIQDLYAQNQELRERLTNVKWETQDELLAYWNKGFEKYGYKLHPGLSPEQTAAEWAAKVQEKDRLNDNMKKLIGRIDAYFMAPEIGIYDSGPTLVVPADIAREVRIIAEDQEQGKRIEGGQNA